MMIHQHSWHTVIYNVSTINRKKLQKITALATSYPKFCKLSLRSANSFSWNYIYYKIHLTQQKCFYTLTFWSRSIKGLHQKLVMIFLMLLT